jgi:hypothetical protein
VYQPTFAAWLDGSLLASLDEFELRHQLDQLDPQAVCELPKARQGWVAFPGLYVTEPTGAYSGSGCDGGFVESLLFAQHLYGFAERNLRLNPISHHRPQLAR